MISKVYRDEPEAPVRGPRVWWRSLPRRRRVTSLVIAALLLLIVGGLLARFLSAENAERDADLALVAAQARGEEAGMVERISGCRQSPSCTAAAKANASNPRLRRPGAVKILQLESPTAYSLFGATGKTRLAWTVIGTLPVVQCVDVRRTGNFLTGIHVQLLGLSAPIGNEGRCTKESAIEKDEEEATEAER
jgi:hypothetical protein